MFCRGWRYSPTMVTLQFRVITRNPSRSSWSMLSGGHRQGGCRLPEPAFSKEVASLCRKKCILATKDSQVRAGDTKGKIQAQEHKVVLLSPVETVPSCLRQSLPDNCSAQRPEAAVSHRGYSYPIGTFQALGSAHVSPPGELILQDIREAMTFIPRKKSSVNQPSLY